MHGPQSQPGQSSEEKTPSSAGNHTQVTFLSVDGKNVFLITFKGYLMTKFLCAALSVSYTWLTDVRV